MLTDEELIIQEENIDRELYKRLLSYMAPDAARALLAWKWNLLYVFNNWKSKRDKLLCDNSGDIYDM